MEEFQFDWNSVCARGSIVKINVRMRKAKSYYTSPILKVVITQKYTLLSVELRVKGRQVVFNNEQK